MEDAGELDPRTTGQLEQIYQVRCPRATARSSGGFTASVGARPIIGEQVIAGPPDRRDTAPASTRQEATRTHCART
jgi:hypothetical protein